MKKVGEILKDRRQEKKFTHEDVYKFIKIHPDFLTSLEEDDYSKFSSEIHARGFLKNYAEFLELDADKLIALWRREHGGEFLAKTEKKWFSNFDTSKIVVTPGVLLGLVSALLIFIFFGYLYYQYSSYTGAPNLEIYSPQNSSVSASEYVDITGKTDLDSVLVINNQRVILNKDGTFATSLKLRPGLNTLSIVSVNKLGKETEEVMTIIYREPEDVMPEVRESTETAVVDEEPAE